MLSNQGPAHLLYGASDFEVVRRGSYVLCAVSGQPIPLDTLVYWSAEFQEAYRGAEEATAALIAGGAKHVKKA
jgi:hypothetical protein